MMSTALIVIDLQRDVIANAHDRDGVVSRTAGLVERARAEGVPVVWVQHNDEALPRDTDGWQFVPELKPGTDEPLIHKQYGDAFADTELAEVLERLGAERLVITGASTEQCIRCTLHSAVIKRYDVTLVSDAHTTEDLIFDGHNLPATQLIDFTNVYVEYGLTWPGASGSVATAAGVELTVTR